MTRQLRLNEDWASVAVGSFMIMAVLATSFFPAIPQFGPKTGWNDWTVLSTEVFTSGNSLRLLMTFLYFFIFALAGTWLMGNRGKALLKAFPVVFILSMIAQLDRKSVV